MLLRWVLATVHLLALGIGLGAVWVRARALGGTLDRERIRTVLVADAWWGIAALLWIGSGLWRLFGETEKALSYYVASHVFWTKMALLAGLLAMEVRPIVTLGRWRRQVAAGAVPDTTLAPRLARISYAEALIVGLMVVAATAMARGLGAR
ncbi:MAG TPA: DUF2214 family protein [Gemmatimonadales bacterium]|nr:DUF2214 family protein [Gemmatimonadales bacterium]